MIREIEPRAYDVIWDSDGRRQAAHRGANSRYPDHAVGNEDVKSISVRDVVLFALIPVSIAALFFAPWAIRTALHMVTQ